MGVEETADLSRGVGGVLQWAAGERRMGGGGMKPRAVGGWHATGKYTSHVGRDANLHREVLYSTSSEGRDVKIFLHLHHLLEK